MIDPNDFVENNEAEGKDGSLNSTKTGYPGVGGMSTEDAYDRASREHFRNDSQKKGGKTTRHKSKVTKQQPVSTLPQIGSIEDIENEAEG